MKTFPILLFLLVLFLSPEIFAQDKDCQLLSGAYPQNTTFERKGDLLIARVDSQYTKSVSVRLSPTIFESKIASKCEILQINFSASFEGTKISPTDEITVDFESISNKFLYDAAWNRKLVLQSDGKDIFAAALKQKWRDDITKTIKREHLESDLQINFATLKKLAEAQKVTVKLGKRVFALTESQLRSLVDFYRIMNIPDKNTA